MNNLPNQFFYSKKEDRLNVLSHGIGFILSIVGLIFLLKKGLQDFSYRPIYSKCLDKFTLEQ